MRFFPRLNARTIYFDYNATTPLDPAVREVMLPYLGNEFGNPSSVHHVGRRARAALDDARYRMAELFRCKPSEVVFTSGGTESNNLAIFGSARLRKEQGRHLITSQIEHHAVLHCFEYLEKNEGFEVTYLPVSPEGVVSVDSVAAALRPDTILVSVMAANNETGAIQPVSEIGSLCREKGVLFHSDAVQWFGKLPFNDINQFNADLVSICSHKFHGPKGAGALFIRSPLLPQPVAFGGSHENERRAGTENVAACVALAEAASLFFSPPVFPVASLAPLSGLLASSLSSVEGVRMLSFNSPRLPNTVSFTVNGCDSTSLLAALDIEGVCASSGSACSSGSLNPSHVLLAMGVPPVEANSLIRFSLGRENSEEEVRFVCNLLPDLINRARNL